MTMRLPALFLSEISQVLATRMGLDFPPERWPDLSSRLNRAFAQMACADTDACMRRLLAGPLSQDDIDILASHLTVGETYFFRDAQLFRALADPLLSGLIAARRNGERRLRIWSAGCCTGEEPYSIAISLDRLLPDRAGWDLTILATDLNPQFLATARRGVYGKWSFRATPDPVRDQYFSRLADNAFELSPRIREMVSFAPLNLAEDNYPALFNNTNAMDIIFCCNVLMYFTPEQARQAIHRLHASLALNGCLVVSRVEAANMDFSPFEATEAAGVSLLRKSVHYEPSSAAPAGIMPLGDKGRPQPAPRRSAWHSPRKAFPSIPAEPRRVAVAPRQADDFEQAVRWYRAGEYDRALDSIAAWRKTHAESAASLVLRARIHANQGSLKEALACCERAISMSRLDADAYYLQALILQECGQPELAAGSLKRTLYLRPDHVLAHYTLGCRARRAGDANAARRHFGRALACLRAFSPDETVPESEGLSVRRLVDLIQSMAH